MGYKCDAWAGLEIESDRWNLLCKFTTVARDDSGNGEGKKKKSEGFLHLGHIPDLYLKEQQAEVDVKLRLRRCRRFLKRLKEIQYDNQHVCSSQSFFSFNFKKGMSVAL